MFTPIALPFAGNGMEQNPSSEKIHCCCSFIFIVILPLLAPSTSLVIRRSSSRFTIAKIRHTIYTLALNQRSDRQAHNVSAALHVLNAFQMLTYSFPPLPHRIETVAVHFHEDYDDAAKLYCSDQFFFSRFYFFLFHSSWPEFVFHRGNFSYCAIYVCEILCI